MKPLPRTTDWRLRKRQRETMHRDLSQLPQSHDSSQDSTPSLEPKKRKLYLRDPTVAVPRQILECKEKKQRFRTLKWRR